MIDNRQNVTKCHLVQAVHAMKISLLWRFCPLTPFNSSWNPFASLIAQLWKIEKPFPSC